ncbi:MAG: hypothetical protein IKL72_05815 [Firmicutes bacterium]|nr:hypothetical protein [Bacillota bacterium]
MTLNENKGVSIKTMLMVGGAYASYTIGSGFATGQEVLQFFGSWGHPLQYATVLVSMIMTIYFTSSCYKTGQRMSFDNASDCYRYYCGKYVGYFFDFFSLILVFGILISMFAGCGSTIEQYFGIPKYVGAVGMGIVAAIVVMSGLRRVEQVLGFLGVVIIGYVIIIGIYAAATSGTNFAEATANLPQYVEEGAVLQAGVFGIKHWFLSALTYGGVCLIVSVPFLVSLGKGTKNQGEALAGGIFSGIFFHAGVLLVVVAVLFNLDSIVQNGAQVPLLAAMQNMMPKIAWTFAIVLVLGIFTTVIGYLWLVSGRFAEDKSKKQRIIVACLVVAGVFGGSIIPFNLIINVLYPFAGFCGVVFCIFIIARDIRNASAKKKEIAE